MNSATLSSNPIPRSAAARLSATVGEEGVVARSLVAFAASSQAGSCVPRETPTGPHARTILSTLDVRMQMCDRWLVLGGMAFVYRGFELSAIIPLYMNCTLG